MFRVADFVLLIIVALGTACGPRSPASVANQEAPMTPPVADVRPVELENHGTVRVDPYFWLRDDDRKDPQVIAYLEAENAYYKQVLAPHAALQQTVLEELQSRIVADDATPPVRRGDWWYYVRYEAGGERAIHCRKASSADRRAPEGEEQVMLNENVEAEGHDYYAAGQLLVTDDGRRIAYGEDTVSRRQYTMRIKDLTTGEMLPDAVPNTTSAGAWSADGTILFYVKRDPATLRSYQVWRHTLGTPVEDDVLVHQEDDEAFYTTVQRSRSGDFVYITLWSTLSTEVRYIDARTPTEAPRVVVPREAKHEYWVTDRGGEFYLVTNWEAPNFRLVRAPVGKSGDKAQWVEVLPARDDAMVLDAVPFNDHLVVAERSDGLRQLRVLDYDGKVDRYLDFGMEVYLAAPWANPEMDTTTLNYTLQSLDTPQSYFAHDLASGETTLLKQEEIPGFDGSRYQTERLRIPARDGAQVPVSLVYGKDVPRDGTAPLYVYGYGSYGSSMAPRFRQVWVSLLDRGFVVAIAHIRGGQELGRAWYEAGRQFEKQNTFNDFVDVTEGLLERGYGARDKVAIEGGSAGGLLIGAVLNQRPELFTVAHAAVPFVDVVSTMLDASIPLTTNEYDEWGNPNEKDAFEYMLTYSPYDQVSAQDYPALIVTSGLHDSQVQYWEPAKWVAKLRATKTGGDALIMRMDMETGHGGASGRFERLERTAQVYTFFFSQLGLAVDVGAPG